MIKKHILDVFAEKFGHCSIDDNLFTFERDEACISGLFKQGYPKSFGYFDNIVAYVVKGYPFTEKYYLEDNKLKIKEFGVEQIVIGTLCVKPLANTSLHEVKDTIDKYGRPVQGWTKKSVYGLIDIIKSYLPSFNDEKDSFFLFAGVKYFGTELNKTILKLGLHQIWLNQILKEGSQALNKMSSTEARYFENIFSQATLEGNVQSILNESYNFGRPTYGPFSTEFLKKKVELYKKGQFKDD